MASLFKYFSQKLPTPAETGIGLHATTEANRAVERLLDEASSSRSATGKRKYTTTYTEDRATVGRYAAPTKKRGRPLTLWELDDKVQKYIKALRAAGTPVSAHIVQAAAEGIVTASVTCRKWWSHSIDPWMGVVIAEKNGLYQKKGNIKNKG